MSQFIGHYGSRLTDSYQQPSGPHPLALAYGNYLGDGVPSLGADDPSRQRPTAYVLPRQIELLDGVFTHDPTGSASAFDPTGAARSVLRVAPPAALRRGAAPQPTQTALRTGAVSAPQSEAYGLPFDASLTADGCLQAGCTISNTGGCRCPHAASTVYFPPQS